MHGLGLASQKKLKAEFPRFSFTVFKGHLKLDAHVVGDRLLDFRRPLQITMPVQLHRRIDRKLSGRKVKN